MTIKIYNSLKRSKELFVPLEPGRVKMYVCGPTVYDSCHIGHARSVIVFDVIYRYLTAVGYDVTYVRNFTDIDDKIIEKSLQSQRPFGEITKGFEGDFLVNLRKLNVRLMH